MIEDSTLQDKKAEERNRVLRKKLGFVAPKRGIAIAVANRSFDRSLFGQLIGQLILLE